MNRLAPKIEVEFGPGVTGNFLLIPAGAFYAGGLKDREEAPRRLIASTKPFYMQETTVTQRQYRVLTGQNHSKFQNNPDNPVEQISWNESVDFAKQLSQQTGLVFRLPTEMEWEYAARGGDGDKYTYAGSNDIEKVGWIAINSNRQTEPIKQKKPNGYGLYDMSGNVWEWCSDNYYDTQPDKELIDYRDHRNGPYRVIRGGSWNFSADRARVALRDGNFPVNRDDFLGLRLVLETL